MSKKNVTLFVEISQSSFSIGLQNTIRLLNTITIHLIFFYKTLYLKITFVREQSQSTKNALCINVLYIYTNTFRNGHMYIYVKLYTLTQSKCPCIKSVVINLRSRLRWWLCLISKYLFSVPHQGILSKSY